MTCEECDRLRVQLKAAHEALRDVLAEGIEHDTRSYAVVQMSHSLRDDIRTLLAAGRACPDESAG